MKQEGRHIDFYATQARTRLSDSRAAQRLTRWALDHFWSPVGTGVVRTRRCASSAPTSSGTLTDWPWPTGSTGGSTASGPRRLNLLHDAVSVAA